MNEKMKVLYIQVGKKPQIIEIKHTLKEMQRLVGGVYYAAVRKLKQYCGENADGKSRFTDLPPDKQKVFGAIFATATFKRDYLKAMFF